MDRNTVVLASAGTGKTRRLVETYVDLLDGGVDPLEIVAITFTERAAGEMRDRIRTALYSRVESSAGADRSKWVRAVGILPSAPISTIHGLCGSLLREHGMHSGIDPAFSILDEQSALDLARDSAMDVIRGEIRSGNVEASKLFGDFGLTALINAIVQSGYLLNSLGKDSQWLENRIKNQEAAAASWRQRFEHEIARYGGDLEKIGELADEMDARKAPRHPLRKRDDADAVLPRIGQIAAVPVARELSRLVCLFRERLRVRKGATNVLDFDDLLIGARDLLRTTPTVRQRCQDRFKALLVDEFQDTDELQAEIIQMLAADPNDEMRLAAGKLLIVGDPKQSIYRFRRARVTVFIRMTNEILRQGGALEHLRDNYRSAGPIAELSNCLFEHIMDGMGNGDRLGEVDSTYRIRFSPDDILRPASSQPSLGVTYIAADTESRAATGRAMQAEALARLFKGWKAAGEIESWREIAVLLRAMTNVDTIVEALESHGIPVYVVQGSSFYQKSEVSDLIALLELVLRPNDPALRAIVLTSGLAGVAYEQLLGGQSSSVLDEILRPWVDRRDGATAAEILQDVIRKTNFDAVLMAQRNGPQRVANVGKLIEITRGLAREGSARLDEIVAQLRDRANDPTVREPEAQIISQDEDVVRILTIHQAKGLEFDIVVLPDLASKARPVSAERAVFSDRWGILTGASYGVHRKPLPHSLMLENKREEDDQQFEEDKRLLYVAMTRAKKKIVLSEGFATHAGLWLNWIVRWMETVQPGAVERTRAGTCGKVRVRSRGQDLSIEMLPVTSLIRPEQLSFGIDLTGLNDDVHYETLRRAVVLKGREQVGKTNCLSFELTPSDLISLDGCFRRFHWTRIAGAAEPNGPATGDTPQMRLGVVAHKAMEDRITDLQVLQSSGIGDLEAVFSSTEWREIADLPTHRELPFILHLHVNAVDCYVRGRMDAAVLGEKPRVIDYKFAHWKEGAESSYRMQMAAYALALIKSSGSPTVLAELWYLKAPMKIVRREYSRDEAEGILGELLGRYAAAVQTGEWPKASREYCDRVECGFRGECWA